MRLRYFPAGLLMLLLLASCATTGPSTFERLDPDTGVTYRFVRTPLILYRDQASLAAHARDYANLAPLSVNRSGSYDFYLWLGPWSTIAASNPAAVRAEFESVVLFVDGDPMPLEAIGYTPAVVGLSASVYAHPVSNTQAAYYRVTEDQIRRISEARDIELKTLGRGDDRFLPWGNSAPARESLLQFVAADVR